MILSKQLSEKISMNQMVKACTNENKVINSKLNKICSLYEKNLRNKFIKKWITTIRKTKRKISENSQEAFNISCYLPKNFESDVIGEKNDLFELINLREKSNFNNAKIKIEKFNPNLNENIKERQINFYNKIVRDNYFINRSYFQNTSQGYCSRQSTVERYLKLKNNRQTYNKN